MQSLIDLYSMTPLDKNSATARDEHDRRIAATPYIPEGASVQANVMTVTAPGKKTPAANPPL